MLSTLPKRPASASPDADRPNKRQATSSPEEGELDDATPPHQPVARSPSPPKPAAKPFAKVPFPFKKKVAQSENGPTANGASKEGAAGYEREDERRYRDDDARRRYGLPSRPDDRHARPWGADSWEPGPGRYDRPRWEPQTYAPDSRHYPRSPDRRPYRSPTPPRHHERRPQSRSHSPRSPSSPRSPLTPSSGKEKHRLPPSRPVVPDPATYRAVYDRDRWREDEDSWGRRRSPLHDRYDGYRDGREGWHKQNLGISMSDHRLTDALDSYAPKSPVARLVSPPRLISPRATPSENGLLERLRTPPPPSGLPPPVPLESAATQPLTPANVHSPRPIPPALSRIESGVRVTAVPQAHKVTESKLTIVRKPKRKPVHRTREEEEAVYGHAFVGCGLQGDYAILTKLGEGTFGCVHVSIAIDIR